MSVVYRRRILREKVLQILYAYEMNKDGLSNLTEGILIDLSEDEGKNFARDLVNKCVADKNLLDEKIVNKVSNWEMHRIALIDKLLLRMAICELMFFPDIPPKVSINEAIEIAKNYSTAGSGKFINGILDVILNELKEKGELKKVGRGLVEESFNKK